MANQRRLLAAAAALSLFLIPACTAKDTGAEGLAADLTESLSAHSLDEVPLLNPEATSAFANHVEALSEYPLTVTPGEIAYDMNDAVLPLQWSWEIEGNAWDYDTEVALSYDDSQWWVQWEPAAFAPGLESGKRIGVDSHAPERAEILAGDDTPIITERAIRRYGLDKAKIGEDDLESAAEEIAEAAGVDPESFTTRVLAAGPKAFVEAISVRPEDADAWIEDGFEDLPGALVVSGEALLAPTRTFARELLGRAGEATAEIIEDSDGEITAGDVVGISGLQKEYDAQLRGRDEVEIFAVNASSCQDPLDCPEAERTTLATLEGGAPEPLKLTLDVDLQMAAEKVLANAPKADAKDAPGAAIVAIRPSSGEVLALANAEANEGQNLAAVGQFPPGSTFKVVTALALLRSGLAVDDVVSCPETTTVDGREFKNYDAYPSDKLGEIPFTVAFAESCNTALIDLREEISPDDLVDAAQSLGLGLDLADDPLGYPAFLGSVPEPEEGTEYAASLIGQGRTLASPLAMATVAASVQAGETVIPTLIDGLSPSTEPPTPLTETEAQTLRDLMGAVVSEGTGRLLADLPGEEVLAKTGTAEHGDAELPPHTWMVGIQGDLAVGVFVEHGIGGAETAGPLLRDFLERAAEL